MAFLLTGKLKGDREITRALGMAPGVFVRFLSAWLADERARFVGGKNSKGVSRPGYRNLLSNRRLRNREGTWARQIAHLFKGYVTNDGTLKSLSMRAGVGLRHPNKMTRAMEMLATGGTVGGPKEMPVPVYRNLARRGITKGFSNAKVFKRLLAAGELIGIRSVSGNTLYFDKNNLTKRGKPRKAGLLFIGMHSITIPALLTGRYDFEERWNKMIPAIMQRGRGVTDRAAAAVLERSKLE